MTALQGAHLVYGFLAVPAPRCSLRAPVVDRIVSMPPNVSFAFRPDRIAGATERCVEYTALPAGCNARRSLLTAAGVTARFTARPGA
jgi:hypothetical protein